MDSFVLEAYKAGNIEKADALERIEKAYGKNLSKPEYRYITEDREINSVESSYLTECTVEMMTPMEVADSLLQVFGSSSIPTESSAATDGYNRSLVSSQIIATNAKSREYVVAFRKDVLKNKLISTDKVSEWIKRQTKRDTRLTPVHISTGKQIVQYSLDDEGRVTSRYAARGGILDRLRIISHILSVEFGWSEADATTWILTGVFTVMEAIQVGVEIHSSEMLANKVTLKIDPTSTNDEVIAAYRWAREQYFQPKETRNTTKSELLAMFYKLHEDKKRREILPIWNENCKSGEGWKEAWAYDPETGINNFGRDLKNAYKNYLQGRKPRGEIYDV